MGVLGTAAGWPQNKATFRYTSGGRLTHIKGGILRVRDAPYTRFPKGTVPKQPMGTWASTKALPTTEWAAHRSSVLQVAQGLGASGR